MRFLSFVAFLALTPTLRAYEPPAVKAPRPLVYPDDTPAFKNETIWNYVGGSVQPETEAHKKARQRHEYSERCFVLSRSIVQFWKFARFDPSSPPLDEKGLAARIRQVTERSVWLPALAPKDRVVIPGYHNLHEATAAMPGVFQANLGLGWPFYFRPGNIVVGLWVSRHMEAALNGEIWHDLQMNTPTMLWIYRFPTKLNHIIVVYSGTHDARGYHYHVYDPNYRDRFSRFDYNPATRTFSFNPVYYFKGGPVTARSIYRGLLQFTTNIVASYPPSARLFSCRATLRKVNLVARKQSRGPRVTTGFVDPCIISMETTLSGEIPMLVQFWAAGSREVRTPGSPPRWELTDVVILKSFLHQKKFQWISEWSFKMLRQPSMSLPCPRAKSTRMCDMSALFDHVPDQDLSMAHSPSGSIR